MRASKPFVAWGIDLLDKYRSNIYFRTKCNIIGLQVGFVVFITVLFWYVLEHTQDAILTEMLRSVALLLQEPAGTVATRLPLMVTNIRLEGVSALFIGLVATGALFGALIASVTLRPAGQALEMQRRFIGNVAHELRTPLSVLKTNTEVALLTENPPPSLRAVLAENIEELDRMAGIINNLLSFNAMFRPERMEFHKVNLYDVVVHSVQLLADLSKGRGVDVQVVQEDTNGGYHVDGNDVGLEQLVTNLVKNGIMYTPAHAGKRVTVTLRRPSAAHVELVVEDTGIGIPKKDLHHVMDPFYRVDKARSRSQGASGLGLAIVREVARLHRANVHILSTPKKGTKLVIDFRAYGSGYQQMPDTG